MYEGGGDGVQGEDIVRQTTSRHRAQGNGDTGRWRKKIKRGTRGKTDRSEGNLWWDGCGYLFCGEERNYFMGVDSDAAWKRRQDATNPPTPSLEKVRPHLLSRSSRLEPSYLAIYSLFLAITVILLSRPRISLHLCSFCSSA